MSIAMHREVGGAAFYRNMFRRVITQLHEVAHDMETDGLGQQAEMLMTTIDDLSEQYSDLTEQELKRA